VTRPYGWLVGTETGEPQAFWTTDANRLSSLQLFLDRSAWIDGLFNFNLRFCEQNAAMANQRAAARLPA
jgi:hypothetical protein